MSTWSTLTGFLVPGAVSTSCTCIVVVAKVWLQVLGCASSCPWTTQKAMQSPISPLQIESKDRNLLLPQMYFQENLTWLAHPANMKYHRGSAQKQQDLHLSRCIWNPLLPLRKQKDGLTENHSHLFKSNKNSYVLKSDIMNASSMRSTNPETLTFRDTSTDLDAVFWHLHWKLFRRI